MFSRIRRIVQYFRTDTSVAPKHIGHDLAQTVKESSHSTGGGGGGGGGGSARGPSNIAVKAMGKGAGNYSKSFKKKS